MINKVILVGRLTKDPELKKGNNGTNFCTFRMAVDNRKSSDGTKSTTFVSCVGFGQTADTIVKYARKGRLVGVDGRLSQKTFTNSEEKKVSVLEVVVESFQFMEKREKSEEGKEVSSVEISDELNDTDLPY